jgi:hypothetical protein
VADQSRALNLVLLQEAFDILSEGSVVMSWVVRRLAVVAQILRRYYQRRWSQMYGKRERTMA